MKSAFFVSDIHLQSMNSPRAEAFLRLLQIAQKKAELFVVLGDLFDVWIGAGSAFISEYKPLLDEFKKLKSTCRIIYFEGNHDLHLERFWKRRMGFDISGAGMELEFQGTRVWTEHGDQINRDDRGYLFLRWLLRTRPVKFLAESIPSHLVLEIGKRASNASRAYTSNLNNNSKEIFRTYAKQLHGTRKYDLCIVGHNHIADDFSFTTANGNGRLINLGSWFDEPHYLELAAGQATLQSVDI